MKKSDNDYPGNRLIKRLTPGRPTKNQEILARMTVAYEPENAHPIIFSEGFKASDFIEPLGIEGKFAALSTKLSERLEEAREKAKTRRDSDGDTARTLKELRQWASNDLPEKVLYTCENHLYANERVISALLAHLADHVILGEELKSIAFAARQRAEDELKEISPALVNFTNGLIACGITGRDVHKMSKERLAVIVSAIRGTSAQHEIGGIPSIPEAPSVSPQNGVNSTENSDEKSDGINGLLRKPQNGGFPSV